MDSYYVPTTKMDRYLKQVNLTFAVNLYKSVIIIIETKLFYCITALFSRIEITFLSVGDLFFRKEFSARLFASVFMRKHLILVTLVYLKAAFFRNFRVMYP